MIRKLESRFRLSVLAVVYLSLVGCSSQFQLQRLNLLDSFKGDTSNVLTTGEISPETRQELRINSFDEAFDKDPEATITQMEEQFHTGDMDALGAREAVALAETAFHYAEQLYNGRERTRSAKFYLMAAAYSYDFLFYNKERLGHSFVSPFGRHLTRIYNASITRIIGTRESEHAPWTLPWEVTVGHTKYLISRDPDLEVQVDPAQYEELTPAFEVKIKGLNNLYRTRGIGAPFIGKGKNRIGSPEYNKFYPPITSDPFTVIFKFMPRKPALTDGTVTRVGETGSSDTIASERQVVVSLVNPFKMDTLTVDGEQCPIESDISSAYGAMLSGQKIGSFVLDALLNPGNNLDKTALFFIQPYDPKKIPVVLVHGLYSAPATHIQMLNDLMGVEAVRKNYQFLLFRYPTGLPIVVSSMKLRSALADLASTYNPDGKNESFNKMVILGHSMGGILSRSTVQVPNNQYYSAIFTVPPDQLKLSDEERKTFNDMYFYEPSPFISRAIIIASPLRGTPFAQGSWVDWLARKFITQPLAWTQMRTGVLQRNKEFLTPAFQESDFILRARSSVDNLRADSPIIQTIFNLPTKPGLKYHTIIASEDKTVGPGTTDGLVPYESAHLDGAESEKLVRSWHSCLELPATIAEVKRILLLHLAELGRK